MEENLCQGKEKMKIQSRLVVGILAGMLMLCVKSTFGQETIPDGNVQENTIIQEYDISDLSKRSRYATQIQIEPSWDNSGASSCEGNGFAYEELRKYYEVDQEIRNENGIIGRQNAGAAKIGTVVYSAGCNWESENNYLCTIYADDALLFEQQIISDKMPETKVLIFDSDIYLSWKDLSGCWQTERYSLLDGQITRQEAVSYYDSFSSICHTYMGDDQKFYIEANDKSWSDEITQDVIDSVIIEDKVFLLTEENENRKLYEYQAGIGELTELVDIGIMEESVIAYNDKWLYWTTKEGNVTTICRKNVITEGQEKICDIIGCDITAISAEKDYLIFETGACELAGDIFSNGEFVLCDSCAFAMDLTSKEILLVEADRNMISDSSQMAEIEQMFKKVSTYIDQFAVTPAIVRRAAKQTVDNYTWDYTTTIWTNSLGIGAHAADSVVVDLTTGIGEYWREDADGTMYDMGTLDFIHFTGSGEWFVQTFFEDRYSNTTDDMLDNRWSDGSLEGTFFRWIIDLFEGKDAYGLKDIQRAGMNESANSARYLGRTPKGNPFFLLMNVNGQVSGCIVFNNHFNDYIVFDKYGNWQMESMLSD